MDNVDHELRLEVRVNPCQGRGNIKVVFNLTEINILFLMKAIEIFKEFFKSIDYTVDGLSIYLDKLYTEITITLSLNHNNKDINRIAPNLLHNINNMGG